FKAFKPVEDWFNEKKPDAIVYIFNDHVTSFFFDHYSSFTLGIGEEYPVADEGGSPRDLPPIKGDPKLAAHIATSLVTDEFELSYFQGKPLDHGFFSPMSVLLDRPDGQWPTKIVPLQVGVLQFPIPTAARCFKLGKALRRAIESYPEDIDVAVVATGGLSHQVHGEGAGFNNPEWDHKFLDAITDDPTGLTAMTHAEYAKLGGFEGAEVIMWLVMRGALSDKVKRVTGTYPFDIARSVKGYRINKFLHDLVDPEHRARFLDEPETAFKEAGLTEEEQELIRGRDWPGMIHYGVIFFTLW